jgi:hypothetical protein
MCARHLMERSTAINVAHNKKMTELSTALLDAGKAGTLFTVDEVGNLMQTDRPYAQLVRSTLSGGAKLTVQPVFTADMSLGEYAESNWHQLTEAQTTWSDLGGSLARSSHMDEVFDNLISSGADNNDDEKADKRARVGSLMARMILNRIQAEQCWDALAPSTSNDYTIVEAALAAPITSSSIYDYVLQEPATPDSRRAAQARFGNSPTTSMKPKAAIAAKKYVGVLAAPDAPGGRASRFITEIAAIGDVATTLTVDPGSEITVIDTDFLASLGEAVAQPAHSVAPTQIAGWNNTADGELHSAWLVAVRPQWCDEPRWVLMYAARIAGFVLGTIIWGIDAAEQVGTVVTMSRLAPPRCTAPQCEAPLAPPTSEASESARVAIMAPDPSAPGLDGQCTAGEVISTIEATKFTVARAVDIALAKVDACVALAERPDLQNKVKSVMLKVSWRSKHAPPPDTVEPPIVGHVLRTRLIDGAEPFGRARDRRYTAEQTAAIEQQANEWVHLGIFDEVNDDSVSVTSAPLLVAKYDDNRVKVGIRFCGDYRRVNKSVRPDYKNPPLIKAICATRLRAQRPTPELASFPRAARFAAIHIDVMPMPLSAAGNTCALMIVDRTTGAARAVPMKTKSTADIVKGYQRE